MSIASSTGTNLCIFKIMQWIKFLGLLHYEYYFQDYYAMNVIFRMIIGKSRAPRTLPEWSNPECKNPEFTFRITSFGKSSWRPWFSKTFEKWRTALTSFLANRNRPNLWSNHRDIMSILELVLIKFSFKNERFKCKQSIIWGHSAQSKKNWALWP